MDRLPGAAAYDLILVHSRSGDAGSQHALERVVAQGRYVLVDTYFQTWDDCLSVSDFLLRYRDAVTYALVIPSRSGELLIKVDPAYLEAESKRRLGPPDGGSETLREQYTAGCYLRDCGGWETFEHHRAHRLDNTRLQSLFDLAMLTRPKRLLDLGCGRGEITYQATRRGIRVTAVDYSRTAIEMAKTCFEGEPELEKTSSGSAAARRTSLWRASTTWSWLAIWWSTCRLPNWIGVRHRQPASRPLRAVDRAYFPQPLVPPLPSRPPTPHRLRDRSLSPGGPTLPLREAHAHQRAIATGAAAAAPRAFRRRAPLVFTPGRARREPCQANAPSRTGGLPRPLRGGLGGSGKPGGPAGRAGHVKSEPAALAEAMARRRDCRTRSAGVGGII